VKIIILNCYTEEVVIVKIYALEIYVYQAKKGDYSDICMKFNIIFLVILGRQRERERERESNLAS
jgi:hypothetical protein